MWVVTILHSNSQVKLSWAICFVIYNVSYFLNFLLCRLKRPWMMTPTTQTTKFPQWRGDRCPAAGQGRESLLLTTEKRVCSGCFSYILTFSFPKYEFLTPFPALVFLCFLTDPSSRDPDLAFKTPIRPIMRHEHILSEINPVSPRNTTARNIYSPIVRFLTPSKESEYSCCRCHSAVLTSEKPSLVFSLTLCCGAVKCTQSTWHSHCFTTHSGRYPVILLKFVFFSDDDNARWSKLTYQPQYKCKNSFLVACGGLPPCMHQIERTLWASWTARQALMWRADSWYLFYW